MRDGTICLLHERQPTPQVLLGWKKYGFGAGKWVLPGGKIEAGESPRQAAARELQEETGLQAGTRSLIPAGTLSFQFPHRPEWGQLVHVFVAHRWTGALRESNEVLPRWFAVEGIPYREMWSDSIHWLPQVLAGLTVRLRFAFGPDNDSVEQIAAMPDPRLA
jgi:8-oxo-dGTP diphosphatase